MLFFLQSQLPLASGLGGGLEFTSHGGASCLQLQVPYAATACSFDGASPLMADIDNCLPVIILLFFLQ